MQVKSEQPAALGGRLAPGVALIFLAVIAYFPAFYCGFIWDDDAYVTGNPTIRSLEGLKQIWSEPTASPQYYPLVFTSFWIEFHLWGLSPLGYHVVNVGLHAINGILLWLLLRKLNVPLPWFGAAVFVLHPVHVESVAWITERKNVLSGFFYFAAALAYFRFSPPDSQPTRPSGRWWWYAFALLLFLGALLSKTVSCSLPAALLLVTWWKSERFSWGDVVALVPFFALGLSLALVTVWMEKHHVGAAGPDWELSPVQRVLIAGRALWFYAGKVAWPAGFSFIYPRWNINSSEIWQYVFPLAALAVPLVCWLRRRRWGHGPLVASLYFGGTLIPALGFIDVYPMRYSFVADHFQYLASVGLIALLVVVGHAVVSRLTPLWSAAVPAAGVMCLLVLTILTWVQAEIYTDQSTLWSDTLQENPDCWMAHHNLGELLIDQRKYADAGRHFQEAIRLRPQDPLHHYGLGKALWFQGSVDESARAFAEAVRVNPDFAEAHFKLAQALRRQNKTDEAIAHFAEAARLKPDMIEAHNNLGVALAGQEKYAEAIPHFLAASRLDPNDPAVYVNLSRAHALRNEFDAAIEYARKAVELRPSEQSFQQMLEGLIKEKEKPRGPKRE